MINDYKKYQMQSCPLKLYSVDRIDKWTLPVSSVGGDVVDSMMVVSLHKTSFGVQLSEHQPLFSNSWAPCSSPSIWRASALLMSCFMTGKWLFSEATEKALAPSPSIPMLTSILGSASSTPTAWLCPSPEEKNSGVLLLGSTMLMFEWGHLRIPSMALKSSGTKGIG